MLRLKLQLKPSAYRFIWDDISESALKPLDLLMPTMYSGEMDRPSHGVNAALQRRPSVRLAAFESLAAPK